MDINSVNNWIKGNYNLTSNTKRHNTHWKCSEFWFKDLTKQWDLGYMINSCLTLMSVHFKLIVWNTNFAPCSKLCITSHKLLLIFLCSYISLWNPLP